MSVSDHLKRGAMASRSRSAPWRLTSSADRELVHPTDHTAAAPPGTARSARIICYYRATWRRELRSARKRGEHILSRQRAPLARRQAAQFQARRAVRASGASLRGRSRRTVAGSHGSCLRAVRRSGATRVPTPCAAAPRAPAAGRGRCRRRRSAARRPRRSTRPRTVTTYTRGTSWPGSVIQSASRVSVVRSSSPLVARSSRPTAISPRPSSPSTS